MSELRGKNLLMEDLFHAHWSKNHRQKSTEAELICRQKRQHLKRGQRPQKTHIQVQKLTGSHNFLVPNLRGHTQKRGFLCALL